MVLRRFMGILGFKRQRGFGATPATAPLQLNLADGSPEGQRTQARSPDSWEGVSRLSQGLAIVGGKRTHHRIKYSKIKEL